MVLMREERVSKTYSRKATRPSMVGPRRPLAQAMTISSFEDHHTADDVVQILFAALTG